MKSAFLILPFLAFPVHSESPVPAGSPAPAADGWITLLDDSGDFSKFMDAKGGPTRWKFNEGAIHGDDKFGDVWTRDKFGDFVLELEFKTTGNSGVFIRTADPSDPVQTGIEIQVNEPGGPNKHSVGAIYDLVAPRVDAMRPDDWNKFVITAKGPEISVVLNERPVSEINLDQWTEAGKNPDGSGNKFHKAVKDFARSGHIGFQDHGHAVWYRKVRIKPLN